MTGNESDDWRAQCLHLELESANAARLVAVATYLLKEVAMIVGEYANVNPCVAHYIAKPGAMLSEVGTDPGNFWSMETYPHLGVIQVGVFHWGTGPMPLITERAKAATPIDFVRFALGEGDGETLRVLVDDAARKEYLRRLRDQVPSTFLANTEAKVARIIDALLVGQLGAMAEGCPHYR